jgi:peptidoglycan/xylan/chitin deacetylase (PgdA/CDA1 family)
VHLAPVHPLRHLAPIVENGARWVAGAQRRFPAGSHVVALTFDDGPDPIYTPAILEVLREHDAVATFFMVGSRAERQPNLVRRVIEQGHAIGSHSTTHPSMWELSFRNAVQEYRTARRVLESIVGRSVPLFRPPNGSIIPTQALLIRLLRFQPWLWSIDPKDWEPGALPEGILAALGDPGDGDVILLHDAIEKPIDDTAANRSSTVDALPKIVNRVRQLGLRLALLK